MRCSKAPHVLARPLADVVLGVEVGRRPEPLGELDHVAAGDLEVAALVHARARPDRPARRRSGRRPRRSPGCRPAEFMGEAILTAIEQNRPAMERSPPRTPAREGRTTGLAYALWLPDRSTGRSSAAGPGRVVVVARRRAPARRTTPTSPGSRRRTAGRRSPSICPATATPSARCRAAAVDDVICDGAAARRRRTASTRGRVALRGSSLGGFLAITRGGRCPGDRRRDRDLPRGRGPSRPRRPPAALRDARRRPARSRGLARWPRTSERQSSGSPGGR